MGSRTHTASTHHCGKWCGTTWRDPMRLRTGPYSWDKAAALCPGMHSLIHKLQRSNAASCCLHLHKHTNKIYHQIWLKYCIIYILYFTCNIFIYFHIASICGMLDLACGLPFVEPWNRKTLHCSYMLFNTCDTLCAKRRITD